MTYLSKRNFTLLELKDMIDSLAHVLPEETEMELIQTTYYFCFGRKEY